jgi:ribonucleoside-diphosphate reductase alpha chain
MDACYRSQAGEPGVFWTNSLDWGTNPCAEIALRSRQFCNLTEINIAAAEDKYALRSMVWAATVLGTLQAGFTNFNYIHPDWSKNAREDALLGVGMTGQAERPELMTAEILADLADYSKHVNKHIASLIGINPAKRIGTVKPSGTTSTVLGTTSGIHAAHAPYYFRRIRIAKIDPVAQYLQSVLPLDCIEQSDWETHNLIFKMPIKTTGITRHDETALELAERSKLVRNTWITASHRDGENYHNVSLTINYKQHEEQELKDWMWENREYYGGISLLPFSDATYMYAPFEECTEEQYNALEAILPDVDLSTVQYAEKDDGRESSASCEGGLCELKLGV